MLHEETFNNLYAQWAARLTNWLAANDTDYGTACDIVQECFLRLWEHRATFTAGQVPPAWLFTTTGRLRTDAWRRTRRHIPHEDMDTLTAEDGSPLTAPESEGDALLRRRLVKALAALPEEVRAAYTLYQVGGNSVRDVAAITGATENLVKVRIHRARQRLQKLLADVL